MKRNTNKSTKKKHIPKVNKKKLLLSATAATLIGAGGLLPASVNPIAEPATVEAAEDTHSEWTANSVEEVEQELATQNAAENQSYQIRWGDTLSALSLATGISVSDLALQNNIEDPDLIYAGDFLTGDTYAGEATKEAADETVEQEAAEAEEVAEETLAEEAPADEEPAEEADPEEVAADEPAQEAEDVPAPGEPVPPMETTDEEPEAVVVLPEDAEEEVVEEEVPEPEEVEAVEVVDVETTEETVEPEGKVVTTQTVAVVAEPESHLESSRGFVRPAEGRVSSRYGYRTHPISAQYRLHAGMDIAGSGPISAVADGTVVAATYQSGWGNYVKIDHGNGLQTLYAHMADGSTNVSVGDEVSQGDTIGTMGQTGSATGVHLHFEVYLNGIQVDPAPYLEF